LATIVVVAIAAVYPVAASAHLHPFNPAAACAPERTGAGNEAVSFIFAPGIVEHWNVEDLRPDIPGVQFLIQISNPGKADESQGGSRFPPSLRATPACSQPRHIARNITSVLWARAPRARPLARSLSSRAALEAGTS
jgi:hypothetical protein